MDLGSRNAEAVPRRWPDGSHTRWLLIPAAVAALGEKKQANSCLPRTTTLPVNQSRRFAAVMDSAMDLLVSSSGRSPHRFRPWLLERADRRRCSSLLATTFLVGGHRPLPAAEACKSSSPMLSQSASHPGYGARLDATEGKGSRAVPREAPVNHGLPAGDSTRRPSTGHWFLGLHMHLRRPPYFAFCVPDGVKGASSWLGAVSHIFGRWDSRKRGGAVINARPPRPRLQTVGNFMMVLLTSYKVFSSGLLY